MSIPRFPARMREYMVHGYTIEFPWLGAEPPAASARSQSAKQNPALIIILRQPFLTALCATKDLHQYV